MKVVSNMDLNGNQIINSSAERVAELPTTGLFDGRVIYNTRTNDYMYYSTTDSSWHSMGEEGLSYWEGTQEEFDAALEAGELSVGTWVMITDDEEGTPVLITVVEVVSADPTTGLTGGRVIYNTNEGKLKVCNGSVWKELGSVEIISADPVTDLTGGRMIYNTTDHKVKYYNGTEWISCSGDVEQVTDEPAGVIREGRLVMNTQDHKLKYFNGTEWVACGGGDNIPKWVGTQAQFDALRIGELAPGTWVVITDDDD